MQALFLGRSVPLCPPGRHVAVVTDAPETLASLLADLVTRCGDRPFLAVGSEHRTGRELAAAASDAARALWQLGFRPGDRLAIHLHRCLDEAVAFLAACLCGGMAVPINPKLKDEQVLHVLRDCEPFAVVASATKTALLREPGRVFAGQRLLHTGAPLPPVLQSQPFGAALGRHVELPTLQPEWPAVILYTSGSTGLSKGIVQPQQNLVRGARIVADYLELGPDDHVLALLPFSFDYGLNQLLAAMQVGCRVTAADYLGIGELAALLAAVRPTGLAGVPMLWHDFCRGIAGGALRTEAARSLRYVTNSGGKLAGDDIRLLREQLPATRVFSMYGLTEAFRSAYLEPGQIDRIPDSFGKAIGGVELLLVDVVSGEVLDGPATGELVHCGALVADGYWRHPEATAARFRPDPRGGGGVAVWSGDLVRRDADGYHYFVARLDRMLKVQGHRVSPDEVAAVVSGFPGVDEVAVLGLPGGPGGDRIALCIGGPDASDALVPVVMRHCRSHLPGYMLPQVVLVLPHLPRNANDKPDLQELQRRIEACQPLP